MASAGGGMSWWCQNQQHHHGGVVCWPTTADKQQQQQQQQQHTVYCTDARNPYKNEFWHVKNSHWSKTSWLFFDKKMESSHTKVKKIGRRGASFLVALH